MNEVNESESAYKTRIKTTTTDQF